MSDDWDLSHWFLEDDDWIQSISEFIRDLVTNPVPATYSQLDQFAGQIAQELEKAGGARQFDLRALEATARVYDFDGLPVSSLMALTALVENRTGSRRKQDQDGPLSGVPITQLITIIGPKRGKMEPSDIAGIMKLAAKQQDRDDVFEGLKLDTVADNVSHSGLQGFTLMELREALEAACAAGLFRQ